MDQNHQNRNIPKNPHIDVEYTRLEGNLIRYRNLQIRLEFLQFSQIYVQSLNCLNFLVKLTVPNSTYTLTDYAGLYIMEIC